MSGMFDTIGKPGGTERKPGTLAKLDLCYGHGLPASYHGCGNVKAIQPDFIEMGLDTHNPPEAKAGLDVCELRRQYAMPAISAPMNTKRPHSILRNGGRHFIFSAFQLLPYSPLMRTNPEKQFPCNTQPSQMKTTMNPTPLLFAILASLAAPALAASIGVNFTAGYSSVAATDEPGIVAGANWNNISVSNGSGVTLQDDTATATLTHSAAGQWGPFSTPATANAGTNKMYQGALYGGSSASEVSVTLASIPYALYDIYVFGSQDTGNPSTLSVTNGTTTYYYKSAGASNAAATSLLKTTSTTSGSPTPGAAQYQVFKGLTNPSVTITQAGSVSGALSNNLFGIHIVEISSGQPVLTGTAVDNITATGANAKATLADNDAEVTLVWADTDYGTDLAAWQANGGSAVLGPKVPGPITGTISGLTPNTTYHYRFYAVNANPDPDLAAWSPPASFATASRAGSIGVNFTHAVTSTAQPGIVAGANWNNLTAATGAGVALRDSSATPTTATLTYTSAGQYNGFSMPATPNADTNRMYQGGLYGGTSASEVSMTLASIPYALYDIYVFGSQDTYSTSTLSVTNGTTTYYYRGAGATNAGATSLLKTTSTDANAPTAGKAQYQVFRRLTSPSVTITQAGSISGVLSNCLFGFHIVEIPAGQPVLTDTAVANITGTGADATATLENSAAGVTLFWAETDYGTDLAEWQASGSSAVLGQQVVGPIAGTCSGLAPDTRYICRFYAVNTNPDPDLAAWSPPASFTTSLAGKAVSDLAAQALSALAIGLTWTDNFDTETGFIIQRSPTGAAAWTTLATVPANRESYTDVHTGLAPATAYDYRVLATNTAGNSAPSNVVSATTDAATPLATQLLIRFDGTLVGTTYTRGQDEIDTTNTFKANGTPVVAGGLATINPGTPGGSDGFDINPTSLGSLNTQNWVAEALVTYQSIGTAVVPTTIDVQGDTDLRFLYPNNDALEMVYYNGATDGRKTTGLPPVGSRVHLALAWDASTATLSGYVNGTLFGTVSQGARTASDPTNLSFGYFGRAGFDNRGINAVLDAVAFQTGTATFTPASGFLILPAGTSYSGWIAGFPAVGTQNRFGDDADNDQLPNGVEAFFGTDPGAWNAGLAEVATNGAVTTFTHPQAATQLNDASASYQWSLDLENWYAGDGVSGPPGGPTVNIPPVTPVAGTATVTATVTATASAPVAKLFVRVLVTNN